MYRKRSRTLLRIRWPRCCLPRERIRRRASPGMCLGAGGGREATRVWMDMPLHAFRVKHTDHRAHTFYWGMCRQCSMYSSRRAPCLPHTALANCFGFISSARMANDSQAEGGGGGGGGIVQRGALRRTLAPLRRKRRRTQRFFCLFGLSLVLQRMASALGKMRLNCSVSEMSSFSLCTTGKADIVKRSACSLVPCLLHQPCPLNQPFHGVARGKSIAYAHAESWLAPTALGPSTTTANR